MSGQPFELKHKIVRAGAGAGKTTQLTQNIYDVVTNFYKHNQRWPRIVVTTFTRKATQELKERLIVKACNEQDDSFLKYIDAGSDIHISTIHGVLNLFLRNYGHIVGWDNSFQIIGTREAVHLAKSVVKELDQQPEWDWWVENFTYNDLLNLLLSYYENVCTQPKMTPANEQVLNQLIKDHNLKQQAELHLLADFIGTHFTNEKWLQFAQALEQTPAENIGEYLRSIGGKPRKTKDVDPEADLFVKNQLDQVKKNLERAGLDKSTSQSKAQLFSQFKTIADIFVQKFLDKKKILSKLEMKDLELVAKHIIDNEPSLATAFADEWDYWLIDEYQDTSPLQEELLKALIHHQPHYVVGDPQQSIYLFRGARSEVFLKKEQELEKHRQELFVNYRSYPDLLEFINDIFSGYKQTFLTMVASDRYGHSEGDRVVAKFYKGQENKFVCDEIIRLLEQGTSP
ncbi:MAG: UvrD-helicase domain-containing protein, partial [Bdellovibrionales bacterium]|nr:UvrD-helicase domain-containing protein [Bdellovibrionales bacterium]